MTILEPSDPSSKSLTTVAKPQKSDDRSFDLEHYLSSLKIPSSFDYQHERPVLHRLAKKVDVVKSLKTVYAVDLSRAVSKDLASDRAVYLLVEIFLHCALSFKDYKLLNSALKIFDGILDSGRRIKGLDGLDDRLKLVLRRV
jgi:hypothetical protein